MWQVSGIIQMKTRQLQEKEIWIEQNTTMPQVTSNHKPIMERLQKNKWDSKADWLCCTLVIHNHYHLTF